MKSRNNKFFFVFCLFFTKKVFVNLYYLLPKRVRFYHWVFKTFFVWSLAKYFTKHIAGPRLCDCIPKQFEKTFEFKKFWSWHICFNFSPQRFLCVLSEVKCKRFSVNNILSIFPFYLNFFVLIFSESLL